MRIQHNFKYQLILLFCLTSISFSQVIQPGSVQAYSDGIKVTLQWVTTDESNLNKFEILRSHSYNNSFIAIASVDPKGPSMYEFVDNSALMRITTVYFYRIKVILSNGEYYFPALNEAPITVNHNVSGVRRTWGSIKAMFR